MKTDRFDEEFRRKLLGLPAEIDPGEVERIQGFVNTNKPGFPGLGWGKLLLYSGSSLLLIGSITYNVIQNYRNTRLQASIDSLVHHPVSQSALRGKILHDTVYITRSGKATESIALPNSSAVTTHQKPLEPLATGQSTETEPTSSVAREYPNLSQPVQEGISSRAKLVAPRTELMPTKSTIANSSPSRNQRREGGERSNQVPSELDESIVGLPPDSTNRSATDKAGKITRSETVLKSIPTGTDEVEDNSPNGSLSPTTRASSRRSTVGKQTDLGKGQSPAGTTINERLATNHSRKQNQRKIEGLSTTGFTPVIPIPANPGSSGSMPTVNRQLILAEPLSNLQTSTTSNRLAIISPSQSLIVPKSEFTGKAPRRSWHLTMPSLSVPNAQYQIGVGLLGGSDQAAAALLGEIRLNRHWSVQAGLQLGYNQGFHYRDEQDFDDHEQEDFRQTYAAQVPSSSNIQDIRQMSLLVQVPIQVAYHYPLGRQWGLRLGFGTNLNLWLRSAVSYNYRENSRSAEHGFSLIEEPTYVVNDVTLSPAVERTWKKWLFRAGPYLSPQLRPVGYKSDDLTWGGTFQIFYRLGK